MAGHHEGNCCLLKKNIATLSLWKGIIINLKHNVNTGKLISEIYVGGVDVVLEC